MRSSRQAIWIAAIGTAATRYVLETGGKTLGQPYVDKNAPKIRTRLKMAGVRLGAALNRILGE